MRKSAVLVDLSAASVIAATAAVAETKLTSVTSLDQNNVLVRSFKANYLGPVNAQLKGDLSIKYLGGQEIVPPRKAVTALKRGQSVLLADGLLELRVMESGDTSVRCKVVHGGVLPVHVAGVPLLRQDLR